VLSIVVGIDSLDGKRLRGRIGRSWMMIRDMDIAAELMGIRPLHDQASAFAVSSYYLRRGRCDDGVLLAKCS
jgi:branched-chain amino acid transport system permease protein